MLRATVDQLLPTTITGSLPRPSWYTENLGLKSFLAAMVETRFREQYEDALAVYLNEQTIAGLDIVTDGDVRFTQDIGGQSWTSYPPFHMSGFDGIPKMAPVGGGGIGFPRGHILHDYIEARLMPSIVGPVGRGNMQYANMWKAAQRMTSKPVKFGTVTPELVAFAVQDFHYTDIRERIWAISDAFNEELHELADAGCPVIQMEEPQIHLLAARGIVDDVINPEFMLKVFNNTVRGLRRKTEVWCHTCWGNPSQQRMFAQIQSYKPALKILNKVDADVITFESCSSGGIDLEAIGKEITRMKIAIGVIDHHSLQVERPEEVAAHIRLALQHIPLERLVLSSDCGMGREGMALLGELVADGENAVRRNAGLSALERQGPYAVPHLEAMLGRDDPELVLFALQSLSRIGFGSAGPAILPLLHHADPNVAQAAIEAVGKLRVREAVPPLCGLLQGDLWLQLAAIAALGDIGHPAAVVPLLAFVPDSVLAEPAVQALRRIAAPESLEPLLPLLLAVRERALRDPLLLAVAVVIELHPDPDPPMSRVARDVVVDGGDLVAYLGQLLAAVPEEGDGDEGESLLRAAATLVAAAGIAELHPVLLSRLASDPMAQWIEGLLARFPDRIAPHLPALLEHPDPDVRCGALRVGAFGPSDLSLLVHHLNDPRLAVRTGACLALGRMGIDAVAPLLLERLRRGEPPEQAAAAQGLARLSPAALGELETCLEPGTAEPVVVEALAVLGRTPVPALEPRVLQLAESPSAAIRLAALRAAARLGGARPEVVLLRALADRHQPIQTEALELLVRRGGDRSVTMLVALLGTADSLRFHVIRALGQCRAPGAASRLRALFPECGPHEQFQILWSLLRIAPPWLSEFLLLRLADRDLDMRRAAAQGLAEVAGFDHLRVLLTLAEDSDWDIRNSAARGLGRVGTAEARAALLTLVRDVESVVAATARAAIEQPTRDAPPGAV